MCLLTIRDKPPELSVYLFKNWIFYTWLFCSSEHHFHLAEFLISSIICNAINLTGLGTQGKELCNSLSTATDEKRGCILRAFVFLCPFNQLSVVSTQLCKNEDGNQVFSLVLNPHAFKHLHLLEVNRDEKKSLRGLNPTITCLESTPHLSLSQRFYKIHCWGQMSLFKSSSVIFKVNIIASPHKKKFQLVLTFMDCLSFLPFTWIKFSLHNFKLTLSKL